MKRRLICSKELVEVFDADSALISGHLINFVGGCEEFNQNLFFFLSGRKSSCLLFRLLCVLQTRTWILILHDVKNGTCWCANCQSFCSTNKQMKQTRQTKPGSPTLTCRRARSPQFSLNNTLSLSSRPLQIFSCKVRHTRCLITQCFSPSFLSPRLFLL